MKKIDDLDEAIKKEYGKKAIFDGITNMSKFKGTSPKILWILKEANNSHTDNPSENQRDFHADVTCYPKWRYTFKRIISCSYAMINGKLSSNKMPWVDDDATIDGENVMLNIALININKCGGESRSKKSQIVATYEKHKDFILRQIEQINPDVIINCSGVESLIDDLQEKFGLIPMETRKADCYYSNFKLLIDYCHPNSTRKGKKGLKDKKYYKDIVGSYIEWKELPPLKK